MKKIVVLLTMLAVVFGIVFANGTEEAAKKNEIKVALIVSATVDDKGWCQSMHDGILQAMKEMPGKIADYKAVENTQPADTMTAIRTYVNLGYNIIIVHGSQFKAQVEEASKEFPDVMFAYGTTDAIIGPNVFSYMPQSEETGFLSGIIAAMTTKANHIGCVGPIRGGDAVRYDNGFILGAKSVNPNIKVDVTYIGNFNDTVKSAEFAENLIQGGCDVLTGSSQQALGALRAVANYKTKDIWWVGQDIEQIKLAEGYKCIAASAYNYKAVVIGLVNEFEAGNLGGKVIPLNFNNGGFEWAWNDATGKVTPEIKKAVEAKLDEFKKTANLIKDWDSADKNL